MEIKEFAKLVKDKLEEKLDRVVTPKQMEHMWKELNIQFTEKGVSYQDGTFHDLTTRDENGVCRIAHQMVPIYNWYDILAGLPEPVKRPIKIDLNKMIC